jgi:hypothetical protein
VLDKCSLNAHLDHEKLSLLKENPQVKGLYANFSHKALPNREPSLSVSVIPLCNNPQRPDKSRVMYI